MKSIQGVGEVAIYARVSRDDKGQNIENRECRNSITAGGS
jgi:hypothetical protein